MTLSQNNRHCDNYNKEKWYKLAKAEFFISLMTGLVREESACMTLLTLQAVY